MPEQKVRPFLKWVGGKTSTVPKLIENMPLNFCNYYEPFLGGGALFFAVDWQDKKVFLNDINKTLIGAFENIRDHLPLVIEGLGKLQDKYLSASEVKRKEMYYDIRKKYNREKNNPDSIKRTIYLIFLNKTCFNGMYRENSAGEFNVPIGRYKNPKILDEHNLKLVNHKIQKVTFEATLFQNSVHTAQKKDLVYFDPPYFPVSNTSGFTSYNENNFLEEQQLELRKVFEELDKKGVYVMLSNSYTEFILKVYKGYNIKTIFAPRFINSKSAKRGKVKEVLISNY